MQRFRDLEPPPSANNAAGFHDPTRHGSESVLYSREREKKTEKLITKQNKGLETRRSKRAHPPEQIGHFHI